MTNPNIYSAVTILGKTDVQYVGTSASAITTNPAGSNKVLKINTLLVSNADGSSDVDVNVNLARGTNSYIVAKTVTVPADSSLVVLGRETPVYLNEGDSLTLSASAASSAHAVSSYEELY